MTGAEHTWSIPSKLGVSVIAVLLGGAISFNAWAVAAIYERPSEDDVLQMIDSMSPFSRDRAMIMDALNQVRLTNIELRQAVARNTEVIAALRAQLAND